MLDGLDFVPVDKVRQGMGYLRTRLPDCDGIVDLRDYLDACQDQFAVSNV